jgi:hypothetical protein
MSSAWAEVAAVVAANVAFPEVRDKPRAVLVERAGNTAAPESCNHICNAKNIWQNIVFQYLIHMEKNGDK